MKPSLKSKKGLFPWSALKLYALALITAFNLYASGAADADPDLIPEKRRIINS